MRLKIFLEDILKGGLADKKSPGEFDPDELELGIKTELEHTDDKLMAKEIAMDHLVEDPKYYTKLKKFHTESVKVDQNKVMTARKKVALRTKVRPQDLEFIGMETYAQGEGYYFNIMDKSHKNYKSTIMELL